MTDNAVTVENLTVSVSSTGDAILDSVSCSIAPGSVLGVVGESGSGKSTLGLALLGHTRPGLQVSGGRIDVRGNEVTSMSSAQILTVRGKVIAYVPQDASVSLNPARRIGVLLDEVLQTHAARMSKQDRLQRCLDVLAEVDLPNEREFLRR